MSTRSFICMATPNGATYSIYCHSDGYPDYVGQLLAKHWTKSEDVRELLELGNLSILGETLGEKHDFDWMQETPSAQWQDDPRYRFCRAYGRDRGDVNNEALTHDTEADTLASAWGHDAEYLYIWQAGQWDVIGLRDDAPSWGRMIAGQDEPQPLDDAEHRNETARAIIAHHRAEEEAEHQAWVARRFGQTSTPAPATTPAAPYIAIITKATQGQLALQF